MHARPLELIWYFVELLQCVPHVIAKLLMFGADAIDSNVSAVLFMF